MNFFYLVVFINIIYLIILLRSSSSTCCSRKWRFCYVSMQNQHLKIFSKLKNNSDFEEFILEKSKLLLDVARVDLDSFIYYGIYDLASTSSTVTASASAPSTEFSFRSPFKLRMSKDSADSSGLVSAAEPVNRESCITIYDFKSSHICVICFGSKSKALERYAELLRVIGDAS